MVRRDEDWLRWGRGVPAPDFLVLCTDNFMDDYFWCFDTRGAGPHHPIVVWRADGTIEDGYPDFLQFVVAQIEFYERR